MPHTLSEQGLTADVLAALQQHMPTATSVQSIQIQTPNLVSFTSNTSDAWSSFFSPLQPTSLVLLSDVSRSAVASGLNGALVNPEASYQSLTATLSVDNSTHNYTSLLYYTSSNCLEGGTFGDDGRGGCELCPEGAYCPGGGRAWPLAGYWSVSEFVAPLSCLVPESCPGVDAFAKSLSATVNTQVCATNLGYTNTRCATCITPGFYQMGARCFSCGSVADQLTVLMWTLIIGGVALLCLAVAIAALQVRRLVRFTQWFITLQSVAVVSVSGVTHIPYFTAQLTTAATYVRNIHIHHLLMARAR